MKRLAAVATLCLAALVAFAQAPELWRDWRYSAPIDSSGAAEGKLLRAAVPPFVNAHAQPGWRDLRIVSDTHEETPYLLHAQPGERSLEWRRARLLEVSFASGENTQGIVDMGLDPPEHNSLQIELGQQDYFVWVEIAISGDARAWRILTERAPIYRFASNNLSGNQTVRYSASRSRYLRVRLLEGKQRLPLDAVRVAREVVVEPEFLPVEATFRPDPAAPRKQTWWVADLGAPQPIARVRFTLDEPEFYRTVHLSYSQDSKYWLSATDGDIYRVKRLRGASTGAGDEREQRERLHIAVGEARARYWRVEVLDRDDPPLPRIRIALDSVPRYVVFRPAPGRTYRLLYGTSRAAAPAYSMAQLVEAAEVGTALSAVIGAETFLPEAPKQVPWTERNAVVLWIALAAATGLLGWLAIKALRG